MQFCLVLIVVSAVQSTAAGADNDYYGLKVGDLTTNAHDVSGTVYVVDTKRLLIRNFVYDGKAPAAFFWIGVKRKSSSQPSDNGIAIPDEKGNTAKLGKYKKANIVLTLPKDITVDDLLWVSVWCKQFSVNFGDVVFPGTLSVPSLAVIGQFSTISHGVRSGSVTIEDSQTIFIKDIHYDGKGTDVYFVAGNDSTLTNSNDLVKVPRLKGQLQSLPAFAGDNITLTLPQDLTVYDIRVISVYSFGSKQDFGHVNVSLGTSLVPPHIQSANTPSRRAARQSGNGPEFEPIVDKLAAKQATSVSSVNSVGPTVPLPKWYRDVVSTVCTKIGELCHILNIQK